MCAANLDNVVELLDLLLERHVKGLQSWQQALVCLLRLQILSRAIKPGILPLGRSVVITYHVCFR